MTALMVINTSNCKLVFTITMRGDENMFDFYGVY